MDSFKYLWDEKFMADDSFSKLKSVSVFGCLKLSVVFPSKICTRFQRVEKLSLTYCDRVEEIYQGMDVKEANNKFCLRDLRIDNLLILKHIWNKESEWATFQNLQSVEVDSCNDLKYVFKTSVGRGLIRLQQLELRYCSFEVLVSREQDYVTSNPSFQFLELTELKLVGLKEMRTLYEGPHTFYCPKLISLEILQCTNNILLSKVISSLEKMEINEQGFLAIQQSDEFSFEFCFKLKMVTLCSLNEETSTDIIFSFLRELKSLERLVFKGCSFKEILGLDVALNQRPTGEERHCLLRVKHLELWYARKVKLITKLDSQFNHFLQHLQTLHLECCDDVMSIAQLSTSFQNLTTLQVQECYDVINLVTASTAKTMVHLMEMKIGDCGRIEEIVAKDGDNTEHDVISFSKLRHLELFGLPELHSFCADKSPFSFPSLEQVTINQCSRMDIFCSGVVSTPNLHGILFQEEQQWEGNLNNTIRSQLRKWVGEHLEEGRLFKNLESLEIVNNSFSSEAISVNQMQFLNKLRNITVRDCDSMQVVFNLEGDVGRLLPKLDELELINLPMLSQLCNKAPKGILDFNRLRKLKINKCSRLVYVFTWSMVPCLSQLQIIQVENCEAMKALIVDEEDAAAKAVFSSLQSVLLKQLPRFSSIYVGSGDLECPSLDNITLMECPGIKAFISTTMHSPVRVLPKLKLSVDMKSIRGMMQFNAPTNLFVNLKALELKHCSKITKSHVPLVGFLLKLHVLDQLKFCDSSIKELLNSNLVEAPPMLDIKSLTLRNLDELTTIWWDASLFQSLKTLEIQGCGKLVNFASSSASFRNLATLEIYKCDQLMSLMKTSTARNMVQLQVLRVLYCKMLMEIVADGSDQRTKDIVFTNLKTLGLFGLQNLKAFSLSHCNFKFPYLSTVTVSRCSNMGIFCHGIINAPMLSYVQEWVNCDTYYHWEGDLNATTKHLYQEMVGFKGDTKFKLSQFPMLKEKWEAQIPMRFLVSVERLEVDNCERFLNAIPSHLLQHLESLKILIVENCNSVKQVIDLEGFSADECGTNQMRNLRELQLIDLPRPKKVWSEDPWQILSLKNLQNLKVHNCGRLTFLFDLSMALNLKNLQHVEVKNCSSVKHIILLADEETTQKCQTIFPSLQSMTLLHLTNLLSICSTSGVLEFQSLKTIEVADCPNMDLFGSTFSEEQDSCITSGEMGESISIHQDPDSIASFLGNKMVIPGLEELKVEWKDMKDEPIGCCQSGIFSRLKCVELAGFLEGHAILPPASLHLFVKLEKLALVDALSEEINLNDLSILFNKDPKSLPLLKKLNLSKMPNLKHLVRHDSQSVPLKILAPPSALFHNLKDLEVSKCDGLINIISASTASYLVQLKRIIVKDCKMMREIVGIALDGPENEIRFSQLECLELGDLPCITCFSSGNHNIYFPSLQDVMITGCPNMKIFAERVSVTPKAKED